MRVERLRFWVPKNYVINDLNGKPYYTFKMGEFYNIEDPRYQEHNVIWDLFRHMVLRRDKFICTNYKAKDHEAILQVHHIKRVKTHPHLLFDIDNCVTLCKKCHGQLHEEAQSWKYEEDEGDDEEVLCEVCGEHYHKARYEMCYYCYEGG